MTGKQSDSLNLEVYIPLVRLTLVGSDKQLKKVLMILTISEHIPPSFPGRRPF